MTFEKEQIFIELLFADIHGITSLQGFCTPKFLNRLNFSSV